MPIQNLIDVLTPLCARIMEQGSMAAGESYPPRFFTFWNDSTPARKFYDNAAQGFVWYVDVNFYSTDHADVYSTLAAAIEALQAAGWEISERGHAVASDYNTHTGRGFTARYSET